MQKPFLNFARARDHRIALELQLLRSRVRLVHELLHVLVLRHESMSACEQVVDFVSECAWHGRTLWSVLMRATEKQGRHDRGGCKVGAGCSQGGRRICMAARDRADIGIEVLDVVLETRLRHLSSRPPTHEALAQVMMTHGHHLVALSHLLDTLVHLLDAST